MAQISYINSYISIMMSTNNEGQIYQILEWNPEEHPAQQHDKTATEWGEVSPKQPTGTGSKGWLSFVNEKVTLWPLWCAIVGEPDRFQLNQQNIGFRVKRTRKVPTVEAMYRCHSIAYNFYVNQEEKMVYFIPIQMGGYGSEEIKGYRLSKIIPYSPNKYYCPNQAYAMPLEQAMPLIKAESYYSKKPREPCPMRSKMRFLQINS